MDGEGRTFLSELDTGRQNVLPKRFVTAPSYPCPSSRTVSLTGVDSDLVDWASEAFGDIDVCGDDINDNTFSTQGILPSNTAITIESNRPRRTITSPANGDDQDNLDNLKHAGERRIVGTTQSRLWVY